MPEVVEKKSSFKKTVRDEVKSERLGDLLKKMGRLQSFSLTRHLPLRKKAVEDWDKHLYLSGLLMKKR